MIRHTMTRFVYLLLILTFASTVVQGRRNNFWKKCEGQSCGPGINTNSMNGKYPLKSDKIAIIGAGPSGIHMAYKLKSLGYKDITIFERSGRVGGKSYTYHYKGTRHEFGTVYTTFEYTELIKLLKEFGTGKIVPAGSTTRWINPHKYFVNGTYPFYVLATESGITDPQVGKSILFSAVQKYVMLHRQMFQTYEGDLFPRPSAEVLHLTRGTFMEYLERNNITILKSIFISSNTIQGYGHLDEISALYGLIWNTPEFLLGLLTSNSPVTVGVIDNGYQPLWTKIARRENLNIKFNTHITGIRRCNRGVRINYQSRKRFLIPHIKTKRFDFLILAANMKDLFQNAVKDNCNRERNIFDKATHVYFTTTLIDSDYYRRGPAPTNYLIDQAYSKTDHVVWANMDSYALLSGQNGVEYMNGTLPDNPFGEFIQSAMYYQIGKSYPTKDILNAKIQNFATDFRMRNYTVVKQRTWKYFPRYSPEQMSSGILWDILDLQGYKRTWYIGSSVCFESVKSVLEYNNLLLRKFNLI